MLVAAIGRPSRVKYRLYVPDNVGDKVAASWSRGGIASIADYRTEKDVCPTHLKGEAVHYLYPLVRGDSEFAAHGEVLFIAARSISHLGWGVDMVAANAAAISDGEADALPGERWQPVGGASGNGLRVPIEGTLDGLMEKHAAFLSRFRGDSFAPVAPLSTFGVVSYRRATDPSPRPFAAFSILRADASGFRPFDTVRRALTVAGMTRHATKLAAEHAGWPKQRIGGFILGHAAAWGKADPPRFAFLPLPSVEARDEGVVGSVRRVMLSGPSGQSEDEIAWARRALSGQELVGEDNKEAVALLSLIPGSDGVVRRYTESAATWATVTPVVLPGYDDPAHYRRRLKHDVVAEEQKRLLGHLAERIEGLLRKAVVQAGFSQILAERAQLEWRGSGFWPGADMADRYGVPDHLKRFPRVHVKIHWRNSDNEPLQVPGPICIGGGRFYGLGLFASL
jgi:CRISPR-associated protein Csb2